MGFHDIVSLVNMFRKEGNKEWNFL